MHSPVTGLFRVLLDRFLLPTIRPRFQEQRTTGHTQSAHSSIAMYGVTDSCAKTLVAVLFLYVSKCRACLLRPTRRYEIDLATHRASQGHVLSHEAQCDGIVAIGHDAVLCDA